MTRRVILIGGPHVGKTTLSEKLKSECGFENVHHSDDIKHLDWSASSEFASHWFDSEGEYVAEGVQMARALRKWLRNNPGKPLDADVVWLTKPQTALLKGQVSMAKGVQTVFQEIQPELLRRGARIHHFRDPNEALPIFNLTDSRDADGANQRREAVTLKRSLTKAEWETLPETTRKSYETEKVYVADGENWKLDTDFEDTSGLKSALQKERESRAQFERDLKAEREKFGSVDIEEWNRYLSEKETRETEELKSKGKIDEILEKHKKDIEALKVKHTAELKTLNDELDRITVDAALRSTFEKSGVLPDRIDDAVDLTRPFAKRENGNLALYDKSGAKLDVSLENYGKEILKEAKPWLYAATGAGGTGAVQTNGGNGGKPTKTITEWKNMSPQESTEFFKAGGTLVE